MRAREFITEYITPSEPITLRSLNKIKQQELRHQESEKNRHELMSIMYAVDDPQEIALDKREQDADRREIELVKREADLDLIQQEIEKSNKSRDIIKKMARYSIESGKS